MEHFSPLAGLAGGMMIGGASALLLLMNGGIAGVSGILGGLLEMRKPGWVAKAAFLSGLPLGVLVFVLTTGSSVQMRIDTSVPVLVIAGLLVGFGTRLGSGCTSGHGVCGIARLSGRSIVATIVFMSIAMFTVYFTRHVL